MAMNPDKKAQIKAQSGAQVGGLLFDEAPTEVPAEYSNYNDVFSVENAAELPGNTEMNEHAIELEAGKPPPFGPIYSLSPMELETLKPTSKPIWPTALSGPPSPLPEHLSFLTKSQMETSAFAWIIGASMTSLSKTDIRCF